MVKSENEWFNVQSIPSILHSLCDLMCGISDYDYELIRVWWSYLFLTFRICYQYGSTVRNHKNSVSKFDFPVIIGNILA